MRMEFEAYVIYRLVRDVQIAYDGTGKCLVCAGGEHNTWCPYPDIRDAFWTAVGTRSLTEVLPDDYQMKG